MVKDEINSIEIENPPPPKNEIEEIRKISYQVDILTCGFLSDYTPKLYEPRIFELEEDD